MIFASLLIPFYYSLTISEYIFQSAEHTTLAGMTALVPSALDIMKHKGPVIYFSPTDDAFKLLDPRYQNKFGSDGRFHLTAVTKLGVIEPDFDPETAKGTIMVNSLLIDYEDKITVKSGLSTANVISTVLLDNGIVYSIDAVLLPLNSAIETAANAQLKIFTDILNKNQKFREMVNSLADSTIFIPTDAAFNDFYEFGQKHGILINQLMLEDLILSHIGRKVILSKELKENADPIYLSMLSGVPVALEKENGYFHVSGTQNDNPAVVTSSDVLFQNGVIHIIDRVLLDEKVLGIRKFSWTPLVILASIFASLLGLVHYRHKSQYAALSE